MEKPKRWQFFLILAVIFLTVYNILPTVFFYAKPLKSPIEQKKSLAIVEQIVERVDGLEQEAVSWLGSYCKLLNIKPLSITLDTNNPRFIHVKFKDEQEAQKLRRTLPRAGSLIGFVPAQLDIYDSGLVSKTVTIKRRIPLHIDPAASQTYFQFGSKKEESGAPTHFYKALVDDRLIFLGSSIGGTSENAALIQAALARAQDPESAELLVILSQNLLNFTKVFAESSPIAKRYFASFSQVDVSDRRQFIEGLAAALEGLKNQVRLERIDLSQKNETVQQERVDWLNQRENLLMNASALIKKHLTDFSAGQIPLTFTSGAGRLKSSSDGKLSLAGHHPFIESLSVDWTNETIKLNFYPDLLKVLEVLPTGYQKDLANQLIYNEIALLARQTNETISPSHDQFEISLSDLQGSQTFLALRLHNIAKAEADLTRTTIVENWAPSHPDLNRSNFPIWDYETYQALPSDQKKLGLVVFAPSMTKEMPPRGFKMNSIYVIAKGVDKIVQRYPLHEDQSNSAAAQQFLKDFGELRSLLQKSGFVGYSGSSNPFTSEFKSDFIFEREDYYQDLLKATRENFAVHGTKRYAVLEFSNLEQRILTENKIDDKIHEALLKWRDDYRAAQVDVKGKSKYDIPAPTQNVLWNNFKLSCIKYFRGDERKIIRWGLDLSGGKTVQIELQGPSQKVVTDEADIRQGINELYRRVNKMGVSEVTIRQEGNTIALDFPGSQALSASDLVKASSMYFHVVNEKFMKGPALAEACHRFLQDVWNEALLTNQKEPEELNQIAWRHLYGESSDFENAKPRTTYAQTLYDSGLRLANPQDANATSGLDETFSKISLYRGDDFTDWQGQTHPLLIVFRNFALEGSHLENIRGSYDPSKGNFLSFGIQGSLTAKDGVKMSPRDDLQAWTSQFAKEKIAGTPLETFSRGHGWRMAVILNGSVVTSPTLDSVLRESASITGSFTQHDINRLEADLKAGSLTFTPHILSEKNVSPELGKEERTYGIIATFCALALAIATMVYFYRFGGMVASIAILMNLFIMWAALQNIGAALTLANLAGVILTVAMAVDANILVFERIREEFTKTGRIASAVHAGYRKAFSAIIDSNITTLIAALILMHFDAGPVRGLALTLIIGIISSLFSALFMTRFFFGWWVQNPEHRELKMVSFIKATHIDFLKFTKPTVWVSCIVIALGSYFLITQRQNVMGMDFTGGYALTVELAPHAHQDYRDATEKSLVQAGLSSQDFQVRELHPSNNVRIFLSRSLEQKGGPFFNLSSEAAPKIAWVKHALATSHLELLSEQNLEKTWTAVSGQVSETMRTHAIVGLLAALLCILLYITLRFEFKYALSATLCLIHDVVFCTGAIALLHVVGVPIQLDLHTVAALLTIVGYSLNDTIIVFDRIREDMRLMHRESLSTIINHALNVTLSRTLMTSGITLLVLIPLIVLGGSTIFGFALVMIIGVVFGTLSSLFIAAPLMQYFHQRRREIHEISHP
jgi:SecD/SecF fusion protein